MRCHQFLPTTTRRAMLQNSAAGFGHWRWRRWPGSERGGDQQLSPLTPRLPHVPARAKRVIFLFMWGGPSHVDLFDPKPQLNALSGQPFSGKSVGSDADTLGTALGSPFKFAQHGDSGTWISELFPHLSQHADRMCVMRSMHTEGCAHGEALLRLHTGQANLVRPSVGAWVSYGLGCESDNLPAFITISPPRGHGGVQNYGSAFLPAIHQGTAIGSAEIPISKAVVSNLANSGWTQAFSAHNWISFSPSTVGTCATQPSTSSIEGLIANYELAFRMQSTMPQIMSLSDESKETLDLYGIDSEPTDNFGRQCLLARRFAENGVRYIQVSTDYTWDHHQKVQAGHVKESAKVDRPIAGLLEDLARRGITGRHAGRVGS